MKNDSKSLVWGILLIVVGILFLGNNLNWFYFDWSDLWPLLMIGGGVLFWFGWISNRKEYGLLMPGSILITYGILFLICTMDGWWWMDELWVLFLLGPGLGFLFMYLLGNREKGLLIPAGILIALSLIFWSGFDIYRYFWPSVIILIGIYLILKSRKSNQEQSRVAGEKERTEI